MTKLGQKLVDQWSQNGYDQQRSDKDYKSYPISFPNNIVTLIMCGYVNERHSDYRYNYYCSAMYNSTILGDVCSKYTATGFRISRVNNTIDQWNYIVYAFMIVLGY